MVEIGPPDYNEKSQGAKGQVVGIVVETGPPDYNEKSQGAKGQVVTLEQSETNECGYFNRH